MKNVQGKQIKRFVLAGAALSLLVPTLAACNTKNTDDPNNRRTLRIGTMYGTKSDESFFRSQFTDAFELTHKGIDIEVVPAIDYNEMQFEYDGKGPMKEPDRLEKVKAILTGTNPVDVMIFDYNLLGQLVNDNMLKQLDTQLKEDEIDVNEFATTVIEGIKQEGNNNIYALTPTFMPSALYYNKKLFSKSGVTTLPRDGMNWDEVFSLAKQVAKGEGKDRVFGFSMNAWGSSDGYWDLNNYLAPLKLRMYDEKAEKMTVNTPQWTSAWKAIADLYKAKVIPRSSDIVYEQPKEGERYNPFQGQLFLNGKVAMTIGDYGLISQIQQMNDNADKLKIEKLDWDVVTMPFHQSNPNVGASINLSSLAGINTKAANMDDAWEFVKFMISKEWAKLKSRSTYEMPARKEFIKVREGLSYNVEAFTKLKPYSNSQSAKDQKLQSERPNLQFIQQLADQAFRAVTQDKLTVEKALEEWDTRGNDLLQKIKANPDGELGVDIWSNPIGGNDNGGGGGGMIMEEGIKY